MSRRKIVLPILMGLFFSSIAMAEDARKEQILQAVKNIVNVQFENGEPSAIRKIQDCYKSLPEQDAIKLDECISQDIAYANLSAGVYRTVLKTRQQPRCIVSYDHISQRILKLAQARDVLGNLLANLKAQTV